MSDQRDGPVLIEIDEAGPSPSDVPPVMDDPAMPTGQAMQTMAALAARRPSVLVRWFWRLLVAVIVFFASVAAYDFVVGASEPSGLRALFCPSRS